MHSFLKNNVFSISFGTSLSKLANLLRLVPNEIEKTLFFKNECIWICLNFSRSLSFNYI